MLPMMFSASKVHFVLYLIVSMCFCSILWPLSAFWSKSLFLFLSSIFSVKPQWITLLLWFESAHQPWKHEMIWFVTFEHWPLLWSLFHNPRVVRTSAAPDPPAASRVKQRKPKPSWTASLLLQTRGRIPWGQHEESSAVCDHCLRLSACCSLPVPLDTGTHRILSPL